MVIVFIINTKIELKIVSILSSNIDYLHIIIEKYWFYFCFIQNEYFISVDMQKIYKNI